METLISGGFYSALYYISIYICLFMFFLLNLIGLVLLAISKQSRELHDKEVNYRGKKVTWLLKLSDFYAKSILYCAAFLIFIFVPPSSYFETFNLILLFIWGAGILFFVFRFAKTIEYLRNFCVEAGKRSV